jgi:acetyl-CoA C-acetyltransferase
MADAARMPVIVGVGQLNDRPADPRLGLDSVELMQAALRAADEDAGGGWLSRIDSLGVVAQLSFPALGDVSPRLASAIGARPRLCEQTGTPHGDSPIRLLNLAAQRIARGEIEVAAIAGGEALRTAAGRHAADPGRNAVREAAAHAPPGHAARYGLVAPVDIYPLYENAGRAAYRQTLAEGQRETAEIWSRFSAVAADNPGAWLRARVTAEEILRVSAENRPIAFPYTKLMVANISVNQGAGFIVTSLQRAVSRGIDEARLVYVGAGAAAAEPDDILARDSYARSASLEASLRLALARNCLTADALDYAELYSCFPCVPKMARRALPWTLEREASVVGGLTFGGGPIGNYMSHAVVSMVHRLRHRGRHGLLFGNGGYATHNHSIVLSRVPPAPEVPALDFDAQDEADRTRGVAPPIQPAYAGPATIETYTVFYGRDGAPRGGVVIARTPPGARSLAHVLPEDTETIRTLTGGDVEPVGMDGVIAGTARGQVWRMDHRARLHAKM